jgi:hypothetical protein
MTTHEAPIKNQITKLLVQRTPLQGPIITVIDALDECGDLYIATEAPWATIRRAFQVSFVVPHFDH